MRRDVLCRWLVRVLALALLVLASSARAQPAGLPAVISVGGSGLDAVAVKSAVEHELGVTLLLQPGASERLEIAMTGRRANVTFYAPGREPVTRSVDLPKDTERSLETIAFLAGNLARDEASELLRQLNPNAAGAEPDAVPLPPPPPPPPPPPAPEAVKPAASPPPKAALPRPPANPAEPALIDPHPLAGNLSLAYPTTIVPHTERHRFNLEVGLFSSRVGAIRGAALALGYLRVDGATEGYSYAFLWNRAGPVTGLQMADIVSEGHGKLVGLSYADLVNFRDGDVDGLDLAGIYVSAKRLGGVQGGGIVALSTEVRGVQGGGIVALADDVHGVQGSAIVSVAKDVEGVQVGAVSVASKVHGLQIGIVNVADEIHGGAFGLVSIAKNGRLQPTVWFAGPAGMLTVAVKSVTDLTYTQIGYGYDPVDTRYRQDASLGLHLELGHHLYGETGLGYDETHDFRGNDLVRAEVRLDARVGFEPVHGVTPFIGAGLTRRVGGHGADFRGEYCLGLSLL